MPHATQARLRTTTDIDPNMPHIRGDERRMRQALLNVLVNAVKFTPPGGAVRVSVSVGKDGGVVIIVSDTGIGIPADHVDKLGTPFMQAHHDPLVSTPGGGMGLGLAIVKEIMGLHSGRMSICNREGQGAAVTLAFPAERSVMDARPARAV